METINEKYEKLRPVIKHGDLILFHGKGIMAKIIQHCDSSYWNHIGVVLEINGALFIVDSNASGVQADRLSYRINSYSKDSNFCIIHPTIDKVTLNYYLSILLKRSDVKWIKYDFFNGAKELFNRKFKWHLKVNTSENKDICSDYVSDYVKSIGTVEIDGFMRLNVAFPQDYTRYINLDNCIII